MKLLKFLGIIAALAGLFFYIAGFLVIFVFPEFLNDIPSNNFSQFENFNWIIFILLLGFLGGGFYYSLKDSYPKRITKEEFDNAYNGSLLLLPIRELTETDKAILLEEGRLRMKMYKSFVYLIPTFIIFDFLLFIKCINPSNPDFGIIFTIIWVLPQFEILRFGSGYNNYHLDLKLPIYKTSGELTRINDRSFKINGVNFQIINTLKPLNLEYGKKFEIQFSYFSKHIWELKKMELKTKA